jgi:NAD(P)-dependent dehydrogenase (short-subunit alcohol dehydrogenase family)
MDSRGLDRIGSSWFTLGVMTTVTIPSRAALVTGCSTGIGRSTALALHRAGWPVYATARRPESLRELADAGMVTLALDVTDESSMQAAVDRVETDHGAVGVLVNNAGYALQGPVETTSISEARAQFETNFFGLVRLTQLALPGMRAQGWGRVVNVSSMGGRFTFPGGGFYHASKHAVEAMSDALRYEVAPFGVAVVIVEPGPVSSAFGDTAVGTIGAAPEVDEDNGDDAYEGFRHALAARYAQAYDGTRMRLASSPDTVAGVIVRAVRVRRPRTRYTVGPVAKTLIGLRRFAPSPLFDAVIRNSFPVPEATPVSHRSP